MISLLVHLRTMQLYNHQAHNLSSGPSFFADHGAFGDFYGEHESAYDSVAERLIGLAGPNSFNVSSVINGVAEKIGKLSFGSNEQMFAVSLKLEQELCSIIDKYISAKAIAQGIAMTEGTRQMLGDLCDKAEVRQYKIKQRLKK